MNQNTRPSSEHDWLQYYQQASPMDEQPSNLELIPSHDHQTSPTTPSKPIRRRSRASKKTPTTLLNANANNFRALVQQFTGCPTTAISFGNRKGPVNLNFATPMVEASRNHHDYPQQSQPVVPQMNIPYYQNDDHQRHYSCTYSSSINTTNTDAFNNHSASSVDVVSNGFVLEDNLSVNDFATSSGFFFD